MRPTPTTRHSCWLALLAALDCFLTYQVLFVFPMYGVYGAELNGLANAMLDWFGFGGMVGLKAVSVTPAMLVMSFVSSKGATAKRVFGATTMTVAAFPVVVALSQMAMLATGLRV